MTLNSGESFQPSDALVTFSLYDHFLRFERSLLLSLDWSPVDEVVACTNRIYGSCSSESSGFLLIRNYDCMLELRCYQKG